MRLTFRSIRFILRALLQAMRDTLGRFLLQSKLELFTDQCTDDTIQRHAQLPLLPVVPVQDSDLLGWLNLGWCAYRLYSNHHQR